MNYTERAAEGEVAPEDLLEEISVAEVPEGVEWAAYEDWTAGKVQAAIEAIAEATDEDPQELLEAATEGAKRDSTRSEPRSG